MQSCKDSLRRLSLIETHRVAKLLVSVRSAVEAKAALAGGASIIDVKEPTRGPLGRADGAVWREVRRAIPDSIPVSVALGELNEWCDTNVERIAQDLWSGITFRKLGFSLASSHWVDQWRELRERLSSPVHRHGATPCKGPSWVAVVYLDWEIVLAPDPVAVIQAAGEVEDCSGILFDTWDKMNSPGIDSRLAQWFARIRDSGRFIAYAGSLDAESIDRLSHLEPDVFAVRGAACHGGDRRAGIDPARVARLVELAERSGLRG